MVTLRTTAIAALVFAFACVIPAAACPESGSPLVTTDKSNYGPFETATIAGCGFGSREPLSVVVTAPDGSVRSGNGAGLAGPDYGSTDESGAFALSYRLSGRLPGGEAYAGQSGNYTVTVVTSTGAVLASTVFTRSPETYATCAVTVSGGVQCWGNNAYGQLGTGSTSSSSTPVDVIGLTSGVSQISLGLYHTCAVTESGGATCWGYGDNGELGNGRLAPTSIPVDVSGLTTGVAQISAGEWHTCAVTTSGGVKCWGYGNNGELGNGAFASSPTPVDVIGLASGVSQISAGGNHTCALMTSGAVKCWGYGRDGQLGAGEITASSIPVDVFGLAREVSQISAGYLHTCAVTESGGAKCWGNNASDQLGTGFGSSNIPVDVSGLTSGVAQISTSFFSSCAVTTVGGAKCWGNNGYGQLGTGDTFSSSTPVDVVGLTSGVSQISAGEPHTCALTTTGGVKCWGWNGYGQLGTGSTVSSSKPVDVIGFASDFVLLPEIGKLRPGRTAPIARLKKVGSIDEPEPALASFGRASDPDFFWLPPTVPLAAPPTGPFDDTVLDTLAVEVCELDAAGACLSGPPIERFTSTSKPTPSRIKLEQRGKFYTVDWLTGPSHVDRDVFYRVRVLKDGAELGAIDVDFVQNTPELASVDPTRYLGLVRGHQLTIQFRIQHPSARTRVKVNEVESNGGMPGDWAELYNTATVPLSLAGYVIKDNDGTHSFTLPAGTMIPAGAYYVVEESAMGFGLGSADALRFFAPGGAILVDAYEWTAHAATTYGRCPNGTGAFQTNTTVTKGAANDCSIVIRINEVESDGGTSGDWVELYNPGPGPANLAGYVFGDSDATDRYALAGTVVPADGYLVLDEANFRFGLDSADAARLLRPDGSVADSATWLTHATTTYGRCPNGIGSFANMSGPTKGGANNCVVPVTTVHINEVESNGGVPGDWIELINTGASSADISGWRILDNDDTHVPYTLPAGTTIAGGSYLVVEEAAFGFGLGAAESVRLYDPAGALFESYSWTAHAAITYGRCPNGTGAFITSTSVTKGAANDCSIPVKINEVESSGGIPGDWTELFNPSASSVDISGFVFRDNDDTHSYAIPAGTSIAAGGYYLLEEAAFDFGLGGADSVRIFDRTAALVDSYTWTVAAATTYGRRPNGTGAFTSTASVTKGAANDCGVSVKINEVESSGGVPGDWVELYNPSASPANVSGFIFRDNDDTHTYTIPAATTIAAGGYYLLEEAAFDFGLGGADSARLFDSGGALIDSYTWMVAATTTYGRCPNGTGAFTTTTSSTKGMANGCPGEVTFQTWPGDPAVQVVDGLNVFAGNLSGLMYEGSGGSTPGILWGARNGPGSLFRLVWNGTIWTPDTANNWGAGKTLLYPGNTGSPDAEGVTFAGSSSSAGMYVATERDNNASAISRNSILRFDPAAAGTTLTATHEWNLTADLPVVGANLGMEAITWIPDTFLISRSFFDESKGHSYVPGEYPNHGNGLFFVGLEANGVIYAYALDHVGGGFTRIATITTGFAGVMDLQFDRDLNDLWAVCDDGCLGRSAVLRIDGVTGKFVVVGLFERPGAMPNLNNEGFSIAPATECVSNRKPVFWADDSETGGHSIRRGTLTCTPIVAASGDGV